MNNLSRDLVLYYDFLKNSETKPIDPVQKPDFPFSSLQEFVQFITSQLCTIRKVMQFHDENVDFMEQLGWLTKYNSDEFDFLNRINKHRIVTKSITSFYLLMKMYGSEEILYSYTLVLREMGNHSEEALTILAALENQDENWSEVLEANPPMITLENLIIVLSTMEFKDPDMYILLQDAFFPFLDDFYMTFLKNLAIPLQTQDSNY